MNRTGLDCKDFLSSPNHNPHRPPVKGTVFRIPSPCPFNTAYRSPSEKVQTPPASRPFVHSNNRQEPLMVSLSNHRRSIPHFPGGEGPTVMASRCPPFLLQTSSFLGAQDPCCPACEQKVSARCWQFYWWSGQSGLMALTSSGANGLSQWLPAQAHRSQPRQLPHGPRQWPW